MVKISKLPLEVVMVPLEKKRTIHPQFFPKYPRLYLEYLENKEKIKKECKNEEFIPEYNVNVNFDKEGDILKKKNKVIKGDVPKDEFTINQHRKYKEPEKNIEYRKKSIEKNDILDDDFLNEFDIKRSNNRRSHRDERNNQRRDEKYDERDTEIRSEKYDERDIERRGEKYDERDTERRGEKYDERDTERRGEKYDERHNERDTERHNERDTERHNERDTERHNERHNERDNKRDTERHNERDNEKDRRDKKYDQEQDDDPLSSFLKVSKSVKSHSSKEGKLSYTRNKGEFLKDNRGSPRKKLPPSIAELESGGAFDTNGIKNLDRVSKKDQEQEQKLREYLFKFDLLKRSYQNEEIPKFTINSDPEYVAKTYEDLKRNFGLNDNINKYKKYLMFGFMGIENLISKMLGIDMTGFTKQQIVDMSSYEKMLIELGEKSYIPKNSSWPVEARLLGLIIINAAFFVGSKMAFKSTGTDILGAMNKTANAGVTAINTTQRKKAKMNGPSISLDDIPTGDESGVEFIK